MGYLFRALYASRASLFHDFDIIAYSLSTIMYHCMVSMSRKNRFVSGSLAIPFHGWSSTLPCMMRKPGSFTFRPFEVGCPRFLSFHRRILVSNVWSWGLVVRRLAGAHRHPIASMRVSSKNIIEAGMPPCFSAISFQRIFIRSFSGTAFSSIGLVDMDSKQAMQSGSSDGTLTDRY